MKLKNKAYINIYRKGNGTCLECSLFPHSSYTKARNEEKIMKKYNKDFVRIKTISIPWDDESFTL